MIFKFLILILTIEIFNCQGSWNTVNQFGGQYRDNTFLSHQQFNTNNLVAQENGIYQNNVFNGKKRSVRNTRNLIMESENGGIQKDMRSSNTVKITNNNDDNTLRKIDCFLKLETINQYMRAKNFGLYKNQIINDPKLTDLESISQCINFITDLVHISNNYVNSMYQQPVNTPFQQPLPINQKHQQKQPNVEIGNVYTGLTFNGK